MTNRMTVHKNEIPIYDIILEQDFQKLSEELSRFGTIYKKICIVTDTNVSALYLEEVQEIVQNCCKEVHSFVFPAGEESKNLDTVKQLYETLIVKKFDRSDLLIALGGGVVGDLCGFAAATYLRGISFIQIPTTLLSQVDSSIGGKTGVDFDSYKNMVGAFHMPLFVYANIKTLLTLPEEQFSAGMGEVIKHGLIKDHEYYTWIREHKEAILNRDMETCCKMVIISNQIKKAVVENDPTEKGDRALLNYGHTLGHGIEKLMNFQLLHGHCVALGALAAAVISSGRNMISVEQVKEYQDMMKFFGMPLSVPGLSKKEVVDATKNDKKMEQGIIKFILLKSVGDAYIDKTVTDEEMEMALSHILT